MEKTYNSTNSLIMPEVNLGSNVEIQNYCYIGCYVSSSKRDTTYIGDNSLIRAGTYIYEGNKIGKNFQTGNKVNIREHNEIGDNVSIGTHSVIEHNVKIHNNVRIHSNVFIPEFTVIKDNVWIGPNVVITNAKIPNKTDTKEKLAGVILEENSTIGANVTLFPGITIGKRSFIGAGSVVTKDTEADQIYIGSPAKKFIKVDS